MKAHKLGTYKISVRNLTLEDAIEFNANTIDKHTKIIEIVHPTGESAKGIYQSNSESMTAAQRRIEENIK